MDVTLVNEGRDPVRAPDPGASLRAPRLTLAPADRPDEPLRVLTPADLIARQNPGQYAGHEEPPPIVLAPGQARRTSVDPVAWGGAIPAGRWTLTVEVPRGSSEEAPITASVALEVRPLAGGPVVAASRDATGMGDRLFLAWTDAEGRPLVLGHAIDHPHGSPPADRLVLAGRAGSGPCPATAAPGDGAEDDRLVAFASERDIEVVRITSRGAVAGGTRVAAKGRAIAVAQARARRTIVKTGGGSASVTELPGRVLVLGDGVLTAIEVSPGSARVVARAELPDAVEVQAVPVTGAILACARTPAGLTAWRWTDTLDPIGSLPLEGVRGLALVADPLPPVDEDAVSSALLRGESPPPMPPPPRSARAHVYLPDPERPERLVVSSVRIGPEGMRLLGSEAGAFESRPVAPRIFANGGGGWHLLDRRADGSLAIVERGRPVVYRDGDPDDLHVGIAYARSGVAKLVRLTSRRGLVVSELDE